MTETLLARFDKSGKQIASLAKDAQLGKMEKSDNRMKDDKRQYVDNFLFTLGRGENAVIVGEERNGKPTLLKFLYNRSMIEDSCAYCGGQRPLVRS